MIAFVVNKSPEALRWAMETVRKLQPDCDVRGFESSLSALAAARESEVDVALLETDLPELGGLDLGQYLKELHPRVNLVFLSEGPEACVEAMLMHASGYLIEPVDAPAVKRELDDLRHPTGQRSHKRVFAQTFGNFELFVDGKPMDFKYNRTKEIVALLINNRGAQTTNGEIIGSLWEDDGDPEKKASYLGNLRQDLQNTLKKYEVTDIIVKRRGSMGIVMDRVECDVYDWLEKKKDSKYHYLGDYMNQYSWAEYMHAELDDLSYAMEDEDY